MYDYIKGRLTALTPTEAVVEASGVGYLLHISLQSYTALGGLLAENTAEGNTAAEEERQAVVYVHQIVREDALLLFGFCQRGERELFRLLISVSGIGAGTARVMLSSYGTEDLVQIIATGNVAALKSVKGIGAKTAERTIVDLKSKVLQVSALSTPTTEGALGGGKDRAAASSHGQEAVAALTVLGYTRAACEKVVRAICVGEPGLSAEAIIRQALTRL